MSSFYVGYQPQAPAELRPILRVVIAALTTIAVVLGVVFVVSQSPFGAANFEFLNLKTFEGTLVESPFPTLLMRSTGAEGYSRYLLVAEGKHGFEVGKRNGQQVRLRGKLIYRDDQAMIEVASGSIEKLGNGMDVAKPKDLGPAILTGEIVDTKCYTGVMNPGRGKVHRGCAARCISGGIPAGLLVQDGGETHVYLLTDSAGKPLGRELLNHVAEPVTLTGHVYRNGTSLTLAVESPTRRLDAAN